MAGKFLIIIMVNGLSPSRMEFAIEEQALESKTLSAKNNPVQIERVHKPINNPQDLTQKCILNVKFLIFYLKNAVLTWYLLKLTYIRSLYPIFGKIQVQSFETFEQTSFVF